MSPSDNDRLDSWKAIADYLGRDVHTLMRWEKEKGLPVHSVPGGKRRSVYAFKHEIDAWLRSASSASVLNGAVEAAGEETAAAPAPARPGLLRRPVNVRDIVVVMLAVVVLLVASFVFNRPPPGPITELKLDGSTLTALRPGNGVAWTYEFPQPPVRVLDFLVLPAESGGGLVANIESVPGQSVLHYFSSEGEDLWQFETRDAFDFGAAQYGPPWGVRGMKVLGSGQDARIAALVQHNTWWPAQVVVLDLDGRVLGRFVNSGWIFGVSEVNRPEGGSLLLAGGVSNAHDSGFLAVLDADHATGSSPEEPGSPYECKNCPPGRPLKYFVFSRSELNVLTGTERGTPGGILVGDTVVIQTNEVKATAGSGGNGAALYEFTPDMELKRATFSDRYWDLHRQLEQQGKVDHPHERCPDRNGPRGLRVWDRENGWRELQNSDQ